MWLNGPFRFGALPKYFQHLVCLTTTTITGVSHIINSGILSNLKKMSMHRPMKYSLHFWKLLRKKAAVIQLLDDSHAMHM